MAATFLDIENSRPAPYNETHYHGYQNTHELLQFSGAMSTSGTESLASQTTFPFQLSPSCVSPTDYLYDNFQFHQHQQSQQQQFQRITECLEYIQNGFVGEINQPNVGSIFDFNHGSIQESDMFNTCDDALHGVSYEKQFCEEADQSLVGIARNGRLGSSSSDDSGSGSSEEDFSTFYLNPCGLEEHEPFNPTELRHHSVHDGACDPCLGPQRYYDNYNTHAQGGYGSSSLSQCLHSGNATEPTLYSNGQCTDLQNESPSVDEGFDEPMTPDEKYEKIIPAEILPIFSEFQPQIDSDRDTQSTRSFSSSPKDRKKAIREAIPSVDKERRKPGRKPGQVSNVLHLWEFMRDLLHSQDCQGVIEWLSQRDGVFRVINSTEVARLWGEKKKNKKQMTYEKLSRSLRYSRLEGYFADVPRDKNYPKKLCFKFGPKAKNWL